MIRSAYPRLHKIVSLLIRLTCAQFPLDFHSWFVCVCVCVCVCVRARAHACVLSYSKVSGRGEFGNILAFISSVLSQ